MKDSTRRRALESTARVALGCCLGAPLGACGGQSVTDRVMEGEAQTDPDPSATAAPPTPPTPTSTATAPTPAPTPTATAPTATAPTATAPTATAPTATAPTPTPTPTATTPPTPPPEPPVPPAPTLACLEPIEVVGTELVVPFTPEQKACCESYVEGLVSTGVATPTTTPADPALLNCCRALAYSTLWQTTVTHETCCARNVLSGLDYNQPYCSPWGPPVPPALVVA